MKTILILLLFCSTALAEKIVVDPALNQVVARIRDDIPSGWTPPKGLVVYASKDLPAGVTNAPVQIDKTISEDKTNDVILYTTPEESARILRLSIHILVGLQTGDVLPKTEISFKDSVGDKKTLTADKWLEIIFKWSQNAVKNDSE